MDSKRCTKCDQAKLISEFYFRNKAKGSRQSRCKQCCSIQDRARQTTNRYRKYKRIRQRNRRSNNRKILYNYLLANPCECGENRIPCLQFDHKDDAEKTKNVSDMMCFSVEKIMLEIEKCVVRCANCHAIQTANQQNWYYYVPQTYALPS